MSGVLHEKRPPERPGVCKGPEKHEDTLEEDAYQPSNRMSRNHPEETKLQNNVHRQGWAG